jgi:hypothetical protein
MSYKWQVMACHNSILLLLHIWPTPVLLGSSQGRQINGQLAFAVVLMILESVSKNHVVARFIHLSLKYNIYYMVNYIFYFLINKVWSLASALVLLLEW